MTDASAHHGSGNGAGSRRGWGSVVVVAAFFGLLLWARLLLVTNHPRTAIAEPGASAQVDEDRGGYGAGR